MGDTTLPTFEAVARELGAWDPRRVKLSPYPTARLTTGAVVRFRTAEDPEKLRGPNLSGVWLDEASLMAREAYTIAIACLREKGEQGFLSGTFTPKGVAHWSYDIFGKGRPDTFLVHSHTRDNPFNPPEFAETLLRQYGEGALARQELGGEFLDDDEAKVIPAAWVRLAMDRWREMHRQRPGPPAGVRLSAVGVDVARGGKAQTVLAPRWGAWWAPLTRRPGSATPDGDAVAGWVAAALAANTGALVAIDVIGVGSSAYDSCRRLLPGARILPVVSSDSTKATDRAGLLRFLNVRAFGWWSLRELLDPRNGHKPALPPDDELLADLTAPKWEMTAGGVKIQSKDEVVKALGRSVDAGDAVVYSILLPPGG